MACGCDFEFEFLAHSDFLTIGLTLPIGWLGGGVEIRVP